MQQPNDVMTKLDQLARVLFPVRQNDDRLRAPLGAGSNRHTRGPVKTGNRVATVELGRGCGILSEFKTGCSDQLNGYKTGA